MTEDWTARLVDVVLLEESAENVPAPWAGALLGLGAAAGHWTARDGWQLVVAVSVPVRDYAAVLVACGSLLARPATAMHDVLAEATAISPGTPVRMATDHFLITDRFHGLDSSRMEPRIRVAYSAWMASQVRNIRADSTIEEHRFRKVPIAAPGGLAALAPRAATWQADQCTARAEVAIIGTRSWLTAELSISAGLEGKQAGYDRLRDIVRPDDGASSSWASVILPGGKDDLPAVPDETALVVLDGASGIRWLPEICAPSVVAVIDRSSDDESPGAGVLHRRAGGREVSLSSLGWQPGPGMEALAFEVRV